MNLLDNLEQLNKIDKKGMCSLLFGFPEQCEKAIHLTDKFKSKNQCEKLKNIVISGLGGSAISGDLLCDYLSFKLNIPILVNRNYFIPHFVTSATLFFAVSYSGNTEETISAYKYAMTKNANIIVVTSGGKLEKMAKKNDTPCIIIEKGLPPRSAIGLLFFPILKILEKLNVIKIKEEEIRETIAILKKLKKRLNPEISFKKNQAKQIANALYKKIVLIYAGNNFSAVAKRWKTQLNENSKVFTIYNVFPELNHNEIMGFETSFNLTKNFAVVLLMDKDDFSRIKTRMKITTSVIRKKVASIIEVKSYGITHLARLFSTIYLGDFVSVYLAILNACDPTEIKSIKQLKEAMAKE